MSGRFAKFAMYFLLIFSLGYVLPVSTQDNDRRLVPGFSVDGTISADAPAQVYTYEGSAEQVIKITIISADALALGLLVTGADGNQIAEASDEAGSAVLVLDDVALANDGIYYFTLFPLAVDDAPTEGEFSISVALSASAPDDGEEPVEAAVATPGATEEVVVEATADEIDAAQEDTGFVAGQELLTTAGIEVSVVWNASVDFNLEVRDPVGGTVFWDSVTSDSGGVFDGFNVNGACETFTANSPTETVRWQPGAVPAGSYEILIFYVQDCETNGAVPFTVNVSVDGVEGESINGTTLPGQVFIASFDVSPTGDFAVSQGGVNQDVLPAPASTITSIAEPITLNSPVEGVIENADSYKSYSFDASSGDIVSVNIEATAGSLDTYLFLIDAVGSVVASNDDANAETRNSSLNSVLLDADGTYYVVASRYGQLLGGTEGTYTLTLSGATVSANLTEELRNVELPDGIIEVSLLWETAADLQLLVRDPAGDVVFDDSPTITSGGRLVANGNVGCTQSETAPLSYIYWPAGQRVRPGTYEIDIWFQSDCGDFTPVNATLAVVIGGDVIISDNFIPLLDEHYITTFSIGLDGTVVRGPGGIAGGAETIDYLPEIATAPVITSNVPVSGSIADDNRFDVYTFEGAVNDVVTLRMDATAGTLDTQVFLLSPTGVELVSNDDAVPNETTNSLISEFTLPQNGQYIVIATHYGTVFGGTNGVYNLTLSLGN